jgi:protease IV
MPPGVECCVIRFHLNNVDSTKSPDAAIPVPASVSRPPEQKSNKGCWIVAALGCGLIIVLCAVTVAGLALLISIGASAGSPVSEETLFEGGEGKIAVIDVSGTIAESDSSGSLLGGVYATPEVINEELENARLDSSVKGILLKMNSPGGEVIASDLIYRKVKEVSEEKPVVTWMSSMGASGGYMIAVASDKIIAHPGTMTGSIGVIMQLTDLQGLYDKLGIKTRTFKSGEFKDEAEVFDENPDGEADQVFQSLIDESYEDFITLIAENRGMTVEQVRALADGRVYSGKQAAENGLVDGVGYMEDAIDALEELVGTSNLTVVEYSTGGFWGDLYQYEQLFLGKLGLITVPTPMGAKLYYLMDI